MARDLAADANFEVTAADVSMKSLKKFEGEFSIRPLQADLSDPGQVRDVVGPFGLVLGAMPSRFGLQTLRAVIEAGKPYCDISFMSEDAASLDALAKQKGIAAVVDCGVSPGLSNMMVGFAHAQMDRTERARIYVGGIPKARHWPFQYKAPFAPSDVIEEYTRPARVVENGRITAKSAMSDCEMLDFPGIGTLEACATDGLRTLLRTVAIPDMFEKTLRYPGHYELMRVFRETGFFAEEEITVGQARVRPRDVTAKLLFPKWTHEPDEVEYTILRVIVEGWKAERRLCQSFDLFDAYDPTTKTSSMARTTAFPATIVGRMIAEGRIHEPGVHPPESIARIPGVFEAVVESLKSRGVFIDSSRNTVAE